MISDELVAEAIAFITRRDWASFVELQRFAEDRGLPSHGDFSLEACPNGIMWLGMSEVFVDLVEAIRKTGEITLDTQGDQMSMLSYLADGGALRLPIPKRGPRDQGRGYAKPYWLPTFFRPVSVLG